MATNEMTEIEEGGLHRVTMNLTQRDVKNTTKVRTALHTRSNAQAVSSALSLAASVTELLQDGGELLVRDKDGQMQRVIIPGLM